jgi:UDP-N-acetylmuramate--alanine ligase
LKKAKTRFVYLEESTEFLKKYTNINFIKNINLSINPKIKGEYNLKNIAVAMRVCDYLGIDKETIISTVNNFAGVPRRYEFLGEYKNSKIFIDYAHHPTELKMFIDTFKNESKKTQIIFQPHTYSRTKNLLKEFVEVLKNMDNLVIYKEYSAREKPIQGMTAEKLFLEIKKFNPFVKYAGDISSVEKLILKNSAVAFVGAGDINLIANQIMEQQFSKNG